jgi:hypothetical protein
MEALFFVGIILGALVAAARSSEERAYVMRRLRRAVSTPIGELRDGVRATVQGTVALVDPSRTVIAPLTGRACVFWMVRFDEVGAGDWHTLGRASGGCEFLVENLSGTVLVHPAHARVDLPGLEMKRPSRMWPTSDALITLARQHCKRPNRPDETILRATEHVVLAGTPVVVNGGCALEPDPTATEAVTGYREQLPMRAVLSGTRRTPLVIRSTGPAQSG